MPNLQATPTTFNDLPCTRLSSTDGATALVALHGAHVLSWIPADGRERLFLSERAKYTEGAAIRGGVPVIFPQSGERGALLKHGFARTLPWRFTGVDDECAVFELRNDERTAHWPHAFATRLCIGVSATLEAAEAPAPEDEDPDPYHSPAAGFAWLLRHFDQRMADVAAFLLISLSWCYRCCREARRAADNQWPLPDLAVGADEAHAIRPWRQFKLPPLQAQEARQLDLDFCNRPAQPSRGQLWLL